MADQQPKHVEDETVVEVDAADGRGFQPVDQVVGKFGGMSLAHEEDEDLEDDLANLPRKVQLRIEALRKLQESQAELEEQFEKERRLLELKYEKLYQPLYKERAEIVSGAKEVDAVVNGEGAQQEETPAGEDDENVKGIPGFWLRALMNHSILEELIHEQDLPAFEYLVDIRSSSHEDDNGFKLEFEFSENPFFENKILTKEYDVAEASEDGDAVLRNITGTEIQWKAGQNLCEVTKKVKQRAKGSKETRVISRTEPCESFFQFFTPVEMPSEEDDEDSRMVMRQLTRDFQIGFTIHESIVPQAVLWFTGEAVEPEDSDYDPEEDEDYEDDEEESDSDEEEGAPRRGGKNKKFPALEGQATSTEKPPECKNQ